MYKNPLPPVEQLRQLFRYDPETGLLLYREIDITKIDDTTYHGARHKAKCYNAKHANKYVTVPKNRAAAVKIAGKLYFTHRIIWKIQTGYEPDVVDHINGNQSDNSWSNLRDGSHAQNMKNLKVFKTNNSGFSGVRKVARAGGPKWEARYAQKHLGTFDTKEQAVQARGSYEQSIGYISRRS
jgi:hypothetical protein